MRSAILSLAALLPLLSAALADDDRHEAAKREHRAVLTESGTLLGHTRLVRSLAYSPDGVLASGGLDRRVCIWDRDGKIVHSVDLQPRGGHL